jgi:hypothetical protein
VQPNEITEVLNRPISQELLACDMTPLAYVAKDGTPGNVPIIFTWNGSQIVMCTHPPGRPGRPDGESIRGPVSVLVSFAHVHARSRDCVGRCMPWQSGSAGRRIAAGPRPGGIRVRANLDALRAGCQALTIGTSADAAAHGVCTWTALESGA